MIPKLEKLGTTDENISAGFGLDEEVLNSPGFFSFTIHLLSFYKEDMSP